MPAPSCPTRAPRPLPPEPLRNLAVAVLGGVVGDPDLPLEIAVMDGGDDAIRLGLRPIAGADPIASLIGSHAPPSSVACGLAARGRGLPVEGSMDGHIAHVARADQPTATAERPVGPLHVVHLVSIDGRAVTVAQVDGQEPHVTEHRGDRYTGRVDDVCRRMLGRPTAPPDGELKVLWATAWLDRVLRRVAATEAVTWSEMADLYPLSDGGSRFGPTGSGGARHRWERWARQHLDEIEPVVGTWSDLRRICGRRSPLAGLTPDHARWMDDGIFARTVLSAWPDLDDLVRDLDLLLPPALSGRLRATLDAWEIAVQGPTDVGTTGDGVADPGGDDPGGTDPGGDVGAA